MPEARRAVFLDRDGTILDELGYLGDPAELRFLPGVAAPLRRLSEAGFFLCVATNQSGVARGYFDEVALESVHERMLSELAAKGCRIDAVVHCPHHPDHGPEPYRKRCACRKPAPGLFLEAASRFGLHLPTSWAVGDSHRDLEAARRAGIPGRILVLTGKGRDTLEELSEEERKATVCVPDLAAAAEVILS